MALANVYTLPQAFLDIPYWTAACGCPTCWAKLGCNCTHSIMDHHMVKCRSKVCSRLFRHKPLDCAWWMNAAALLIRSRRGGQVQGWTPLLTSSPPCQTRLNFLVIWEHAHQPACTCANSKPSDTRAILVHTQKAGSGILQTKAHPKAAAMTCV